LLNKARGHWEALTMELGSPNYAKVWANMMDLEGNEVDVSSATSKGPSYRDFGPIKFLPIPKDLFDKPP
jgi:hypothetical protein